MHVEKKNVSQEIWNPRKIRLPKEFFMNKMLVGFFLTLLTKQIESYHPPCYEKFLEEC